MPADSPSWRTIRSLEEIADRFAAVFCDVWGVVHNGVTPFATAIAALERMRSAGRPVLLVSNAPRPWPNVVDQLRTIGVPDDAYDRVITSGDVSRALLSARAPGPVFHIGPPRDEPLFEGLALEQTDFDRAAFLAVTGLFDDTTETPGDYARLLQRARARNLELVCANPDVVVDRGGRLIYCAGALANAYRDLGGLVATAGKPHGPIFEVALREVEKLSGRWNAPDEILMIGDGLATDIAGAAGFGMPSLFVTGGIHAADAADLGQAFEQAGVTPDWVIEEALN